MNDNVYGVVGIVIDEEPLEEFENSIMLSILGECALALENEKVAKEREKAAILAKMNNCEQTCFVPFHMICVHR